ncbi:sulfite exporter TauE/SafE family protein [Spiroplasma tabanidicola]|uniref:Probable membrane transporter protein n=1 Tax=Spiroplasma tabanidicola TaxID=324079 RepID=A0A6I6C929_9MOLU|nr:sulfite exporter TauE/SafE family protein [Spiroplasma tabanidicola]QGS51969.1 sulfite exporter TauE/SafE family protein [Spiroplasma tabanidicola]
MIKNIDEYLIEIEKDIEKVYEISNNLISFKKTTKEIKKSIIQDWKDKNIDDNQKVKCLSTLKESYKQYLKIFDKKSKDNLIDLNQQYNQYVDTYNKDKKPLKKKIPVKGMKILGISLVPLMMLLALCISYLCVNKINLTNQNSIIAFSLSMLILVVCLIFLVFIIIFSTKKSVLDYKNKSYICASIGFTASFFDTLGIGSFATNTGLLKATKSLKDDKKLPGTLNIGMAIPNLFSGVLFMTSVSVDLTTLITFVLSAIIGSLIGSSIVNKINKKLIAIIMGVVLAITSILMLLTVKGIEVFPSGSAMGVSDVWWKLFLGCLAFVFLGIMMSFGVGLYAPAMAVISFLGINFLVVFPIMTCSAGLTMHINGYKFYFKNNYMPKTSFFMTIGGIIGVLTSYTIVFLGLITLLKIDQTLITDVFKWLSVFVIAYSSYTLFRSYFKQRKVVISAVPKISYNIDYLDFNNYINSFYTNTFVKNI